MSKAKPARRRPAQPARTEGEISFWSGQHQRLGRRLLFVDTGAIVGCVENGNPKFVRFFESEVVGVQLVTSSHVVAETIRRIVKAKQPSPFKGPNGQVTFDLALFILKEWLVDNKVAILSVPDEVFQAARASFEEKRYAQCDFTDILSYVIVSGLDCQIVAADNHFHVLGLNVLP